MNIKEALNMLQHDVEVDTRTAALVHGVELLLGGAEGLGYSDDDRSDLRSKPARRRTTDYWKRLKARQGQRCALRLHRALPFRPLSGVGLSMSYLSLTFLRRVTGTTRHPVDAAKALQTVGLMALVCWECLANPDFPALTGAISASSHLKRPGPSGTGRQEP